MWQSLHEVDKSSGQMGKQQWEESYIWKHSFFIICSTIYIYISEINKQNNNNNNTGNKVNRIELTLIIKSFSKVN